MPLETFTYIFSNQNASKVLDTVYTILDVMNVETGRIGSRIEVDSDGVRVLESPLIPPRWNGLGSGNFVISGNSGTLSQLEYIRQLAQNPIWLAIAGGHEIAITVNYTTPTTDIEIAFMFHDCPATPDGLVA